MNNMVNIFLIHVSLNDQIWGSLRHSLEFQNIAGVDFFRIDIFALRESRNVPPCCCSPIWPKGGSVRKPFSYRNQFCSVKAFYMKSGKCTF